MAKSIVDLRLPTRNELSNEYFAHYSKLHSLLTRFSPVNPPGDVPKCQTPAKLVANWAVPGMGCSAGRPGASSAGFCLKRSQNQQKPGFSPKFARRDNSIRTSTGRGDLSSEYVNLDEENVEPAVTSFRFRRPDHAQNLI